MEVVGKIIAVLPLQEGVSKTGNAWQKQEYVLETYDQYPKKICFRLFGADRIQQAAIQQDEEIKLYFDIESREYMGKWYTDIAGWKVERQSATNADPNPGQGYDSFSAQSQQAAPPTFTESGEKDDLPF